MKNFVMNEKTRAERLLNGDKTGISLSDATIISKYYRSIGYKTQQLKTEIERFIADNFPNISVKAKKKIVESAIDVSRKYPLHEIDEIIITKSDVERIQSLSSTAVKNPRLHRLAFVLLCLSKYFGLCGSKDGWVSADWADIFRVADLRGLNMERKKKIISALIANNYIYVPPLSDKSCYKLLATQDEPDSAHEVIVDNINEAGLIFEEFEGKRFVKCQMCGCRVPVTNGRAKHCKTCAVIVNRQKARERMRANSQHKREAAPTLTC